MNSFSMRHALLYLSLLFIFGASPSVFFGVNRAFAGEVAIICHPDTPESALSQSDIKKIFLGRKTRWSNNQKIHFAVMKGSDFHETFLKTYIGKTPSQFDVYWKKMVFTGKGGLPKSFSSTEDMIQYAADTPGAIGYVPEGLATESIKSLSVK